MNEYLNLDEKINIIFDFIYNQNSKKNIYDCNIEIKNVNLNHIKIMINTESYYNIIKNDILTAKFKFINYYVEDNYILLKRYFNNFSLLVKIHFYDNNEDIQNIKSSINNDNLMSYILSILVLSNRTKHILLPIMNFDIHFNELSKILSIDLINIIKKKFIKIDNLICCIQLRECFKKIYNLKEYLELNNCIIIKPILFQIIYTLAVINNEYPGFTHNNLIFTNIFIYIEHKNEIIYDGFKNDKFILKNIEYDVKLTNFNKASITKSTKNNTNDLQLLFKELLKYNFCDNETLNFLKNKYNTYIDMLYTNYFNDYTEINNIPENKLSVSEKRLSVGKYNLTIESNRYTILGNQNKLYKNKHVRFIKSDIILSKIVRRNINNSFSHFGGGNDNIIITSMIEKNNPFNSILAKEIISQKYNERKNVSDDVQEIDDELLENNPPQLDKTSQLNDPENIRLNNQEKIKSYDQEKIKYDQEKNKPYDREKFKSYDQEKNKSYDRNKQYDQKEYDPNPFLTNQSYDKYKEINKPAQITKRSEPALLMEQRVYNTNNPQEKDKKPQPPMFIPIYNNQPTETVLPYPFMPEMHQQKIVNINFGDKFSNFGALDRLYEDYLPSGNKKLTATTIFERNNLIQFIRNSIIKRNDGEEMNLTGTKDVLLSYIKIININPYNKNTNPFNNMAMKFLLYTAAYPIKYNENNSKIEIGNPAMGLNVRIYGLTDVDCKKIFENITCNVWRELKYYDFIKNNIIMKKISPNFICSILYKIDPDCKINWRELESIKHENLPNSIIEIIRKNSYKINDNDDSSVFSILKKYYMQANQPEIAAYIESVIENKTKIYQDLDGSKYFLKDGSRIQVNSDIDNIIPEGINFTDTLTKKALIILTEAPTTNFSQWCSITRESFGSAHRMTASGFHTTKIWKCIIFQLVYIFAILYENNIYMEEITLNDNFYIKDININPTTMGSWIYKIDNLEFYVPNYGYILMFDSKYNDPKSTNKNLKILSTIFNNPNAPDEDIETKQNNNNFDTKAIKQKIKNKFLQIIDSNKFCHYAKISGANNPSNEIIDLLNQIVKTTNTDTIEEIKDLFTKTPIFYDYLHNRMGTYLTKVEKENINPSLIPSLIKEGDLCIFKEGPDEYKWAICLKINTLSRARTRGFPGNRHTYNIVCRNKTRQLTIQENVKGPKIIPSLDKILQENSNDMRYDGSYIFETYTFENTICYFNPC